MKICNTSYEPLVADVIQRHCRQTPKRLVPIPTYPDSIVYEAHLPDTVIIFKAADPDGGEPHGVMLEAWACDRAGQAGVPTPRVLEADSSRRLFPASFFLMTKAEGRPLSSLQLSAENERPFVLQIGRALRLLHSIKLEGYGWLDEQHYLQMGAVRGTRTSWRGAVLDDLPGSVEYLLETGAISEGQASSICRLLERYEVHIDPQPPASLLHNDLGSLHVWVDARRQALTAVLDFGERSAGDPIWDLVEYDWKAREVLLEGYELEQGLRERLESIFYLYPVLRAIPWARRWYALGGKQISDWLSFTVRTAEERLLS